MRGGCGRRKASLTSGPGVSVAERASAVRASAPTGGPGAQGERATCGASERAAARARAGPRAEVWVGPSAWEAARWEREEKSGLRGVGLGLPLGLGFVGFSSLFISKLFYS